YRDGCIWPWGGGATVVASPDIVLGRSRASPWRVGRLTVRRERYLERLASYAAVRVHRGGAAPVPGGPAARSGGVFGCRRAAVRRPDQSHRWPRMPHLAECGARTHPGRC